MTAHREGVWTVGDRRPRRSSADWRRLGGETLALSAGAAALAAIANPSGHALPVGALTMGFGAVGLIGRHADARGRRDHRDAEALREEFGVGPAWPVDLLIRQGEAPTGRDEGLMWIEDGRVMFSGLHTSFALVPAQAAGPVRCDVRLSGLRYRLNLPLDRVTRGGPLSLSFWPIADGIKRSEGDAADLRYALNTVVEGRWPSSPEASGQWPPVAPGPGATSPPELRRQALTRPCLLGIATLAVGAAFLHAPWPPIAIYLVIAASLNGVLLRENAVRWRAYRDACRVWEAE